MQRDGQISTKVERIDPDTAPALPVDPVGLAGSPFQAQHVQIELGFRAVGTAVVDDMSRVVHRQAGDVQIKVGSGNRIVFGGNRIGRIDFPVRPPRWGHIGINAGTAQIDPADDQARSEQLGQIERQRKLVETQQRIGCGGYFRAQRIGQALEGPGNDLASFETNAHVREMPYQRKRYGIEPDPSIQHPAGILVDERRQTGRGKHQSHAAQNQPGQKDQRSQSDQ